MITRGASVLRGLTILGLAILLSLPVACESSSDESDTGGGGTDTATGDTGGGGGMNAWKATLQDFQTKQNIGDGECYLLYNVYYGDDDPSDGCTPSAEAGERVPVDQLPGTGTQPLTSGPDGELDLELPANTWWGFECDKGEGDTYRLAYQYNIDANTSAYDGEEIWVISNGLYQLAPTLAGLAQDETKGVVAGRLVWYDAAGVEEYIGCATVELSVPDPENAGEWIVLDDATSQVRYFADNDLPTTIDQQGQSNPTNGLFIGANMPVGPVTVTAKMTIDGNEVVLGQDTIFSAGNSVVINNVQVGRGLCHEVLTIPVEGNPTPAACR